MKYEKKVLAYSINKWNETFEGINSLQVSHDLNIPHPTVRRIFKRFRDQNKGTLNDGVMLYSFKYGGDKKELDDGGRYVATIFYPSKELLNNYYIKSRYAKGDLPAFLRQLHQGHHKSEMLYFTESVLERYMRHPERYNVTDIAWGGFLSSNINYINQLPEAEAESACCRVTRFGKVTSLEGKHFVTAMLEDLAAMPDMEQRYWRENQVHEDLSIFDPDFYKYYLKFYEGAPADSHDPLNDLLGMLRKINNLPHVGSLFKNLDIHLTYPVENNREGFYRACKNLYKVIGPENINISVLKRFLRKNYNYHPKKVGVRKLYSTFLKLVECLDDSIEILTDTIKDHRLLNNKNTVHTDYLNEFKKLCKSLLHSYSILYKKLKYDDSVEEPIHPPKKQSIAHEL
jgi:hypothetical protein